MNIVMVSRVSPHHTIGGMQQVAWDMAKGLVERNCKVTFLTTNIPSLEAERFIESGVEVVNIKGIKPAKYSRKWWKESVRYFKEHLKEPTDIIISVSGGGYAIARRNRKQIPCILQLHGTSVGEIHSKFKTFSLKQMLSSVKNIYWYLLEFYYFQFFDKIVCPGTTVKKEILGFPQGLVINRKVVEVIYNGLDIAIFNAEKCESDIWNDLNLSSYDKHVIIASRIDHQKGVMNSLRSFHKLLNQDHNLSLKLVIIGDGPQKVNLERYVSEYDLSKDVAFAGRRTRNEIAKFLPHGDLFLFNTLRNEVGFTLNAIEAIASGIPVITSNQLTDLKGVNGVTLLNPRDINSIANQMRLILEDERDSIFLPPKFQIENYFERYLHLMKKIQLK